MSDYSDIINLPHHQSKVHPQMSMHDRAAQFSPFAALTGYEDAVKETARTTEARIELDEQERRELNQRLNDLIAHLAEHPVATITYFVPDERKDGGEYVTVTGVVKKYRADERQLVMSDGGVIRVEDIYEVAL